MPAKARPSEVLAALAKAYKKIGSMQGVPLLERLVMILVGRDVTWAKVSPAVERLKKGYVDWNEVRLARVDDLRAILDAAGAKDSEVRSIHLREMLSKVFTDRHALDAEFLAEEDREKRAAFMAGLPGIDFAQAQAFEASIAAEKDDVPITPQILRVATRLGWLGKSTPVAKAKKVLADAAHGDTVSLTYGLVRIAEEVCHVRNPECPQCPLQHTCPVGRAWKETVGKADAKA